MHHSMRSLGMAMHLLSASPGVEACIPQGFTNAVADEMCSALHSSLWPGAVWAADMVLDSLLTQPAFSAGGQALGGKHTAPQLRHQLLSSCKTADCCSKHHQWVEPTAVSVASPQAGRGGACSLASD